MWGIGVGMWGNLGRNAGNGVGMKEIGVGMRESGWECGKSGWECRQ